ncbi:MAG: ATP-binding protein [Caldilineae bacterium]|nr:MAG: ATP-binding protein [Caldilineae bacterium]
MEPTRPRRVVELKIPSELGYEKIAREAVATVARRMGFSPERIEDIKLAIAEACTNAISYGSRPGAATKILVVLTEDGEKLDILIKDPGHGEEPPTEVPPPDIDKMVKGEARAGGMGLYIIQELMDKAEFLKSTPEEGNLFHMVVYRMDSEQPPSSPPDTREGEVSNE